MKKLVYSLKNKLFVTILASFIMPTIASAHEVYVLEQEEISAAMQMPHPDFIDVILRHLGEFTIWGLAIIAAITIIFFLSTNIHFEKTFDPFLLKLKKWAPRIAQLTLGLALFSSASHNALFGPELPLDLLFGTWALVARIVLYAVSIMLITGVYPRIAGLVSLSLCIGVLGTQGLYMLNYGTYLGETITMAFLGSGYVLLGNHKSIPLLSRIITHRVQHHKFLIMRVLFGISLIYASVYAKLIHGQLALETVVKYNLTDYFHFEPLFIVLGAMLLEILIGICYIVGFEIRFVSIILLVFLSLSIAFFGEAVWPHIILIGTTIAMFAHGYDQYTLSQKLNPRKKDKNMEPVF